MADYMLVDPRPNSFWSEVLFKNGMSSRVATEVRGCPKSGVVRTCSKITLFPGPFCLPLLCIVSCCCSLAMSTSTGRKAFVPHPDTLSLTLLDGAGIRVRVRTLRMGTVTTVYRLVPYLHTIV